MDTLARIVDLANGHQVARITYQKASEAAHVREVEAYRIERGRYEILLCCFQRTPEEGWRQFKPSKIRTVEPAGAKFKPRRKIDFDAGVLGTVYHPETSPAFEFSDLLSGFLSDLEISPAEAAELLRFRSAAALPQVEVDRVCAELYDCAERYALADGVIDAQEEDYLRKYRACLTRAGWSAAPAVTRTPNQSSHHLSLRARLWGFLFGRDT